MSSSRSHNQKRKNSPKPKGIPFALISNEEKQQLLTVEELEAAEGQHYHLINDGFTCLVNYKKYHCLIQVFIYRYRCYLSVTKQDVTLLETDIFLNSRFLIRANLGKKLPSFLICSCLNWRVILTQYNVHFHSTLSGQQQLLQSLLRYTVNETGCIVQRFFTLRSPLGLFWEAFNV